MADLFQIDNHTYNTDPSEIDSEFIRIFGRIPDHSIYWPELDTKKFPQIGEFVEKSVDFLAEHATHMATCLTNRVYEGKLSNAIRIYSDRVVMTISCVRSGKASLGITKENFHRILGEKPKVELAFSNDSLFAEKVYRPLFNHYTTIESNGSSDAFFNIIEADGRGGMYLNDVEVKVEDSNFDIDAMYNDGFPEVHENILRSLSSQDTGLILLHGGFGTGKTSYIRRLIKELSDREKQVIYMPPNMADQISSPNFMTFLIEHKNSIVVIEDAENILKTREAHGNSSVANILNSTDGLLGDALKLQFICTFNADKQDIDPALFRKGRLLQEYEFNNLHVDKARKLWQDVGNPMDEFPEKDMPISDIFNHGDRIEEEDKTSKVPFGFTPPPKKN